mmetsp:Transcript_2959/g.9572  ORF Transcript_2959/g.9572 Transcript_2959/m.9572 type:complete len:214 (+) Transcript_2959:815-1456(+)
MWPCGAAPPKKPRRTPRPRSPWTARASRRGGAGHRPGRPWAGRGTLRRTSSRPGGARRSPRGSARRSGGAWPGPGPGATWLRWVRGRRRSQGRGLHRRRRAGPPGHRLCRRRRRPMRQLPPERLPGAAMWERGAGQGERRADLPVRPPAPAHLVCCVPCLTAGLHAETKQGCGAPQSIPRRDPGLGRLARLPQAHLAAVRHMTAVFDPGLVLL